jgi:hypothetical protein
MLWMIYIPIERSTHDSKYGRDYLSDYSHGSVRLDFELEIQHLKNLKARKKKHAKQVQQIAQTSKLYNDFIENELFTYNRKYNIVFVYIEEMSKTI